MMNSFWLIMARDLRHLRGQGWQAATTLLFFILVVMLLAFGVGPDPKILQAIAPGAVWVAALLAMLLSLDRVFVADHEDGSLDRLLTAPVPPEAVTLAKMMAHWIGTGLPLALLSPAAGLLLHLPRPAIEATVASLLLGTPTLSLIGGAVSALTLGARRGGALLALLTLPLFVPVLIFGAAAIAKALAGGEFLGPLAFLAALLALALPLAPIAAAAALEE